MRLAQPEPEQIDWFTVIANLCLFYRWTYDYILDLNWDVMIKFTEHRYDVMEAQKVDNG